MKQVLERAFVEQLVSRFRRSPAQVNRLHESDAEIVRLPGSVTLAVTTDTVAEEIESGLYEEPWLIGWMAVMVSLSDLAAVGAQPIGVLVSEVFPPGCDDKFLDELQRGMQDACAACNTAILGGDTNMGGELVLSGTAVGVCPDGAYLSRRGALPGDLLYATGRLGLGNAYALSSYIAAGAAAPPGSAAAVRYRPQARLIEGRSLVGLASACMDTSDGVVATLDELMRLNTVGLHISSSWLAALHPEAGGVAKNAGVPPWLMLAGQHGEFELLFTVPPGGEAELHARAVKSNWRPLLLGTVTGVPRLELPLYETTVEVDSARIRNLDCRSGIRPYLAALLGIDRELQEGASRHANH